MVTERAGGHPEFILLLRINRRETLQSGDFVLTAAGSQIPRLAQDERAVSRESGTVSVSLNVIWLWNLLVCILIQYWSLSPGHCVNGYARAGSKTKGGGGQGWPRKEDSLELLEGSLLDSPTKHINGINYCILGNDFLYQIHNILKNLQVSPFESLLTMIEAMRSGPRKKDIRIFKLV